MSMLRAEGFAALVADVATLAASYSEVAAAAQHAATLGARVPEEIGLRALTRPEQHLLDTATAAGAVLAATDGPGERLALTRTGRLRLLRAGESLPDGAHLLGTVQWPEGRPGDLDADLDRLAADDAAEAGRIAQWLTQLPRDRVDAMIERVRETLRHIAPVILYTGPRCYTNLNKGGNLLGKSLAADSPRCVLIRLATTPVSDWNHWDATFLTCLDALIRSGAGVRAEEFNGTQLRPDRLMEFFRERMADYRSAERFPEPGTEPEAEQLYALAEACARARTAALAGGTWPYRVVTGLNLHKREHLSRTPVTLAEVPQAVAEAFAIQLGCPVPADFAELQAICAEQMPRLHQPGTEGFSSRLEELLHELVLVAVEATASDVAMSRGPRRVGELLRLLAEDRLETVVDWGTNAYFCCVAPSRGFAEHLVASPGELTRALRAISARMRYNCWHFIPHGIGAGDRAGDRDWFFAPAMPDMTAWSEQHHTGHIATGVRHAIRVSFGVELHGVPRPGLYDFRVMRHTGDPYTVAEFRQAVAIGEFLRRIYQAHADLLAGGAPDLNILDFDNPWYQAKYPADTAAAVKEQV